MKLDQNGSMWFKMDQIGLNLNKLIQNRSILFKLDQIVPNASVCNDFNQKKNCETLKVA